MLSANELRFFDLVRGGKRMAEAAQEASLTDDEWDYLVLMCTEFLDSERFTTSQYDATIARRLRKLEEGLLKRDDSFVHEFKNLAKSHLELIKSINRLVDAQRRPEIHVEMDGKVVQFPTPPKAS